MIKKSMNSTINWAFEVCTENCPQMGCSTWVTVKWWKACPKSDGNRSSSWYTWRTEKGGGCCSCVCICVCILLSYEAQFSLGVVFCSLCVSWSWASTQANTKFMFAHNCSVTYQLCGKHLYFKNKHIREFPSGPLIRTQRFHCRDPKFNPWAGN